VFKGEAGELDAALVDNTEALAQSRAAGDNYRTAITLANLGVYELAASKLGPARAHLQEACTLADKLGYVNMSVGLWQNLGLVELLDAHPGEARRLFLNSLDRARTTGGPSSYFHAALLGLALAVGADGDPAVAATLHGVADDHYERAGRVFEATEAGLRDRDHAQLRAALGDAAFEAAHRRDRSLGHADAIAMAAGTAEPDPAVSSAVTVPAAGQAPADGFTGPLSAREREIVALVAGGATNAQIAERLFLSVNTVRTHLDRIRDKTGARRRADLVRYAVQAGIEAVAPAR
jgi:DNA-binding CsgD family transcriptional regulator